VVRRGQSVEAIARSGALSVSMRVEAMEEGAPGQLIRIRNPQSRREMRGKVQDENTVVIPL
jgi:flagella basal body P-ring formation protein FlgA